MTREKEPGDESAKPSLGSSPLRGHVTVRIAHKEFKVLKKLAAKEKNRRMSKVLRRILEAYLEERDPSFVTYGPKTRREFFALRREQGGRP